MAPEAAAVTSGLGFLKDNVMALIGAFAAMAIAYGLKESAEYAARTETLGITMGVVAKMQDMVQKKLVSTRKK